MLDRTPAVAGEPSLPGVGRARKKSFNIPVLDGLRGIAFLCVFFSHNIARLYILMPSMGGFGVIIFFFLSGYLITTLLRVEHQDRTSISLSRFYMRRARRIFPPLYITLLVAYVAAGFHLVADRGTPAGMLSAVFYFYNYLALFKPGVILLPSGMYIAWSLMIEEHFYFVFPFLYKQFCDRRLTRSRQTRILLALCAVPLVWRCVIAFCLHSRVIAVPDWTYYATDARFDAILWGCVLAVAWNPWFNDGAGLLERWKGSLALLGLAAVLCDLLRHNTTFQGTFGYSLMSAALLPMFYYVLSTRSVWTRCLEWSGLRQIGQLSYSMYLIHEVARVALGSAFRSSLVTAIVVGVVTLGYALLMRLLVENPLRKLVP